MCRAATWGVPELTAERFVPDPFAGEPGARLYRSGDRARWLATGELEYLGRTDAQVKVRGFRIEPGEIEAALTALPRVREAVVMVREDAPGQKRLVAYVVPETGLDVSGMLLREELSARLPEHMVPAAFVELERLPLNANGKIDRRALPVPELAAAGDEFVAPRTEIEEILGGIWAEVLGVERVGVEDGFFELGGDSILSIQVVSRARQRGLKLTPRQLFERPTIARLAEVVERAGSGAAAQAQEAVTGEAPLTPIQRRFFEQAGPVKHHFNQALLLVPREPLNAGLLARAAGALEAHHDALRLRFHPEAGGAWRQSHVGVGKRAPLTTFDLSGVPEEARQAAIEAAADRVQRSLDLSRGPLLRMAYFDFGASQAGRLLVVIHHLAVDGVSWRILLEDLETAYTQLSRSEAVRLPAKTTSWKAWAERLAQHARSEALAREAAFWVEQTQKESAALPVDDPTAANTASRSRTVAVSLSEEETEALLREVPVVYRTQIDEVLLTALAGALARWTGQRRVRIDLEGHGREEEAVGGADLSRTVGWFTTVYPVVLDLPETGEAGAALRAVKEQLRSVPGRGIGYGLLRYPGGSGAAPELAGAARAEVAFNYLGQFDRAVSGESFFAFAEESVGASADESSPRAHLLEVSGSVRGGRLELQVGYAEGVHRGETVERLAEGFGRELRELIAHCRGAEAGGYTPSDFPLAALDQAGLDGLLGSERGVEDVYPLSPMQEGMLFHALYAPESGVYVGQFGFVLEGPLDVEALERAWQGVVGRHEALRAAFAWEGLQQPLQVIRREAKVPFRVEDWREPDGAVRQERLEEYLAQDRALGFDLKRPPLMRLALFRMGEAEHQLVWTHHHLILDGWSLSLLFRDVLALYAAHAPGETPRARAAHPYRDYVEWLGRQDRSRAERFWREALAGFAAPTPLPMVQPRRIGEEGHGGATLLLAAEGTDALREQARRRGVTLSTLVQGAWALLLSRYAGAEDVLFGATVSGRPPELAGVEETVGLFINTLPVRVRLEPEATLGEWLGRLQKEQAEAREYEYAPLVEVQRWSEVPAGEGLFGSLVIFENYPIDQALGEQADRPDGLRVRGNLGREQTNYPLLLVAEAHARLKVDLRYAGALADGEAARRLLAQLETVLETMAAHPERRLAEVSLLRGAERARLLAASGAAAPGHPQACVHELFAAQAARTPGAPAVRSGDEVLTYAELERGSNRLAQHLRRRGVGPEVRVGICLEPGVELVASVLGVLKAGGAYVPLDPAYPAERLAYTLADSDAPVLVTRSHLLDALPAFGGGIVCLDADREAIAGEPDEAPPGGAELRGAAYVIYTSGSTGGPKGVVVEHDTLRNTLLSARDTFGLSADTVFPAMASYAFDIWAFEAIAPLLAGGQARLLPRETARDVGRLVEELAQADTVHAVPALMREIVRQVQASGGPGTLPGVRHVFIGGDAIAPDLLQAVPVAFPAAQVWAMYGPTEGTIVSSATPLRRGVDYGWQMVGRPLPGVAMHVVDGWGNLLPAGVPGELYLAGAGVARGYLGRAGATAEKFVPDAFGSEPGARLYRTGDRVRRRADGELEFLGRVDFQLKVRGFRIEPGEIEAALAALPQVRETVVLVREDTPGSRRLVAYVVPEAGAELSPSGLREQLSLRLPEHMVPGAYVVLERLPLNPNGKVDRRALPAPEGAAAGEGYVAPRGGVEEILSGIWAEVLGVERVGAEDGFFELGGHSLLATRVVSRARQAFGVEVPLRALFDRPTVAALAESIELLRNGGAAQAPPLERAPRDGALPASFAQQRLWVVDRLEPGGGAYNMPYALRMRGRLDAVALRMSLHELVRRHEALRTVFAEREGMPVQVVRPPAPPPFPTVDLAGLPAERREAEAARQAGDDAARPFDLARGPLLRSALLRLGDRDHVLCFTMHHVVSDAWSMDILVREVSALYAAFSRGEPSPLPELAVQYADFSAWQRSWLRGDVLDGEIGFWKARLAGAPPLLEIPTDRPRSAAQGARAGSHPFTLAAETARGLRALARREGATLFMAVLAAWQSLLGRYAGQDDVVVGSPVAGRTRAETEGLIGFFVNMLALRVDLAGEPTWRELLARVREEALGAYAHQDVPFERLVDELATERSLTYAPIFQVVFALQLSGGRERLAMDELELEPFGTGAGGAKFDLQLTLGDDGGELGGTLLFRAALFDPATVARLAGHFELLLEAMAADPARRPSGVSLLRGAERAQVLADWATTPHGYPAGARVHDLFAAQAARTPDAVAVSRRGRTTTYAELDRASARLARLLRRRGVGPETRVGICMGRTPELLTALLAVLRAGGAYVPLDPAYPAERLGYMVEDAGIALVLTASELLDRLPRGVPAVLALDAAEAREALAAGPDGAPECGATPENLSHVIFTSGSTGRPKGVMIRHSSTVVLLHWLRDNVSDEERSSVLFSTSINFDVSVAEIFGTLCWGGKLVMVENALELPEVAEPVVYASMVPTAARELLRSGGMPASVRTLNLGGEALPNDLAQALYATGTVERVGNLYGPTEDTTYSTYSLVAKGADRVLVGRPLAGTWAYVLDAGLQPVPAGVIGELYLAGDGLARGYAGRPELTAERFLPGPFGAPGSRMYRVMDRVRWRADGELEYFGRSDYQVKVRGFRIEPGEIEAALLAHPGVREAVVVARDEPGGGRRLVAYLAREADEAVPTAELRAHLEERLPDYMVPSAFVVLERLPLTPNGKVDRRALPAPSVDGEEAFVAPRTEVEEILSGVWAEVLRLDRVGVRQSFFELGGDSILTIQVVSRARRRGLELTPSQLFEHPTIERLAEVVGSTGAVPTPAAQGPVRGEAPLTPIQRRFFTRPNPARSHYNQGLLLRPREALDPAVLARAAAALESHHDALRLRFHQDEGGRGGRRTPRRASTPRSPPSTCRPWRRATGGRRWRRRRRRCSAAWTWRAGRCCGWPGSTRAPARRGGSWRRCTTWRSTA